MTSMQEAMAVLTATRPRAKTTRAETSLLAWNHRCGIGGCLTWVPNHRSDCGKHGGGA